MPIYFEVITKQDEEKIASSFKPQNTEDLSDQLHAIYKMEKDSLILAALKAYKQTVEANPANNVLFKSYEIFLLKYGFEEEAYVLWKKHQKNNR